MSILTGPEIAKQITMGRIKIDPFNPANIGPNSVDLSWGEMYRTYDNDELDMDKDEPTTLHAMPRMGVILQRGKVYLMHTIEIAGSDEYAPMLEGRSTTGRKGIVVHLSAGFGDHGFCRQWTLEVVATQPIRVYPNRSVCQVAFHTLDGKRMPYNEVSTSKYHLQSGPTAAITKGGDA